MLTARVKAVLESISKAVAVRMEYPDRKCKYCRERLVWTNPGHSEGFWITLGGKLVCPARNPAGATSGKPHYPAYVYHTAYHSIDNDPTISKRANHTWRTIGYIWTALIALSVLFAALAHH